MKLEVKEEKANPLFDRKEVSVIVESDVTPKKQELIKAIADKSKAPEYNVVISNVLGKFGSKKIEVEAKIYDSINAREKLEGKAQDKKEEFPGEERPSEEKVDNEEKPKDVDQDAQNDGKLAGKNVTSAQAEAKVSESETSADKVE
jgi:ribosomal protein S24E